MAQLTITAQSKTTLAGQEVIIKAIHFFTSERWRTQSQTERGATFVGRPRIPWILIFFTFIAFCFFIIPGIIMYILVIRKAYRFQNIVITTSPIDNATDVSITCSKNAKKIVQQFLLTLPS